MGSQYSSCNEVELLHNSGEFIKSVNDRIYGRCDIYSSHNQSYCVKKLVTKADSNKFQCNFDSKTTGIIKYFGFIQEMDNFGFCNDSTLISFYYQYIECSLKDYINQYKSNNDNFQENDLWILIWSIISTCAFLQKKQLFIGDIRPQTILMDKIGSPKLVPQNIFPIDSNNSFKKAFYEGSPVYLSPELLNNLKNRDINVQRINRYKSDMYSLGLTLLECITHKSSKQVYDYQNNTIYFDIIENRIDQSYNQYSKLLCDTVGGMLFQSESKRPDFLQLKSLFKPYQKQIINGQPFTLDLVEAKRAYNVIQLYYKYLQPQSNMHLKKFNIKNSSPQNANSFQISPKGRNIEASNYQINVGSREIVEHLLPLQPYAQPLQNQYFPAYAPDPQTEQFSVRQSYKDLQMNLALQNQQQNDQQEDQSTYMLDKKESLDKIQFAKRLQNNPMNDAQQLQNQQIKFISQDQIPQQQLNFNKIKIQNFDSQNDQSAGKNQEQQSNQQSPFKVIENIQNPRQNKAQNEDLQNLNNLQQRIEKVLLSSNKLMNSFKEKKDR